MPRELCIKNCQQYFLDFKEVSTCSCFFFLQMNKQDHKSSEVPKKKSRRYRRKPKNLMEEYTRRQREHVWLETHIWHAKRMKMIDAWGYRLADHPNEKGFRAAYRAVKNNCMLQVQL